MVGLHHRSHASLQLCFLHPYRLGVGSFFLWLPTNPDPWWLAGTEARREVGVWSGSCCDINTYAIYPSCCWHECLVADCSPGVGRIVWSEFCSFVSSTLHCDWVWGLGMWCRVPGIQWIPPSTDTLVPQEMYPDEQGVLMFGGRNFYEVVIWSKKVIVHSTVQYLMTMKEKGEISPAGSQIVAWLTSFGLSDLIWCMQVQTSYFVWCKKPTLGLKCSAFWSRTLYSVDPRTQDRGPGDSGTQTWIGILYVYIHSTYNIVAHVSLITQLECTMEQGSFVYSRWHLCSSCFRPFPLWTNGVNWTY